LPAYPAHRQPYRARLASAQPPQQKFLRTPLSSTAVNYQHVTASIPGRNQKNIRAARVPRLQRPVFFAHEVTTTGRLYAASGPRQKQNRDPAYDHIKPPSVALPRTSLPRSATRAAMRAAENAVPFG